MQEFDYTLVANLNDAALTDARMYQPRSVNLQESLMIQDTDISYYRKLHMAACTDGSLSVIENLRRKLAQAQTVKLQAHPEKPEVLLINIAGQFSDEGLTLDVPLISRQEQEFSVLVAEVLNDERNNGERSSIFNITLPLDISGLDIGNYQVNVNGIKRLFSVVD